MRVGQADQLVEVGGDQQHRQPVRAGPRLMWSQIAAWAPTSTPRVGCAAISRIGSPLISRPTMSFCWLPPDSAPGEHVDAGRAHVVLARRSARCPCARRRVSMQAVPLTHRRPASGGRGCGSPRAARRAAARGGAGPRGCSRCRPRGARGSTSSRDVLARRASTVPVTPARMPMIVSTSSAWPLPSTPAMPSTSPRVDVEADVVEQRREPTAGSRLEVLAPTGAPRRSPSRSRCSATGSSEPTISSASWRAVTVGRGRRCATVVPRRMTVISSATGEHLVELVGDEDDREALAP